jgi:galactose mutarotase-like enzyme
MARAYRIKSTETLQATLGDNSYEATTEQVVRLIADVTIHVAFGRPATFDDTRIPAETVELLSLDADRALHVRRADDETDGKVWITQVGLI